MDSFLKKFNTLFSKYENLYNSVELLDRRNLGVVATAGLKEYA